MIELKRLYTAYYNNVDMLSDCWFVRMGLEAYVASVTKQICDFLTKNVFHF